MTTLPASIADLAQVANTPFVSAVDQASQYRQAGFAAVVSWFQAMGGNIDATSDGVANAGAGNFLLTSANIVHDVAGNNHSWMQGTLGTMRLVFDFVAPAGPTPQLCNVYRCSGPYNLDGTLTDKPTPVNADTESALVAWNMIGWGAPVGGSISYQYSALALIGWFWTKQTANDTTGSFLIIERASATDDYYDGVRDWFIFAIVQPVDVLSAGGLICGYDGSAGGNIGGHCVFGSTATTWVNGQACDGRPRLLPIKYRSPVSGSNEDNRVGGYSRLMMMAAQLTPFNQTDPGDPPGDLWGWRVIGAMGVYWLKSDGVIQ